MSHVSRMMPDAPRSLSSDHVRVRIDDAFFLGLGLSAGWVVGSVFGHIILSWLGLP